MISISFNVPLGATNGPQLCFGGQKLINIRMDGSANPLGDSRITTHLPDLTIWVFPKIGVPENGWFIIYNGKTY